MKLQRDTVFSDEDIHLRHYTPAQIEAESLANDGFKPLIPSDLKVLVVIPFRDKWEMTERCLESLIRQKVEGLKIRVALVDNGSVEEETAAGIARALLSLESAGFEALSLRYDIPFNFSYLNNQAVKDCADFNPQVVALINNDIEFIEEESLRELVEGCWLPRAGAVGCTLLYPNGLIQHLFIFVGSKIVGSHPYKGRRLDPQSKWYEKPRAVGAVTGAVMLMRAEVFRQVEGFDEHLPTSYQDVDLCLKFQKLGLVNWVLPRVMIIHHETQTRKNEPSWGEAEYVERKWGDYLFKNHFVSRNWSRRSENFVYTLSAVLKSILDPKF